MEQCQKPVPEGVTNLAEEFFMPLAQRRARRKTTQSPSKPMFEEAPIDELKQLTRKKRKLLVLAPVADVKCVSTAAIFDLRGDARLSTEENARLSAGKPTHPFFSKINKVQQIVNSSDAIRDRSVSEPDDAVYPSPPFHVTQHSESPEICLNCTTYKISSCMADSTTAGTAVDCQRSRFLRVKDKDEVTSLNPMLDSFPSAISDNDSLHQLFEYIQKSGNPVFETSSASDIENLKERLFLYKSRKNDLGTGVLWTDIYQPKLSQQICGNKNQVDILNDWLRSWKTKIAVENVNGQIVGKYSSSATDTDDEDWTEEEAEEISDGDNDACNTLLLTGPVGCGKSAAVYACAKEQGFDIIEINSAEVRSGTLIKQRFGEAFESHRLNKWTYKNKPLNLGRAARERGEMTLILFEEVDNIFEEDRGFLSALVQLSKLTKRPIVLTSNGADILLPHLRLLRVNFCRPSLKELVVHACMVCMSMGVSKNPWMIERLVKACHYDIRKLMLLLQFWGLGTKQSESEGNVTQISATAAQKTWWLDSDAQFCFLSQLSPVSFPCRMSEIISERIEAAQKQQVTQEDALCSETMENMWARLLDAKESITLCSFDCHHEASERSFSAIAKLEDIFSACDVLSTVSKIRDSELAAQLAHSSLQFFARECSQQVDVEPVAVLGMEQFEGSNWQCELMMRKQKFEKLKDALHSNTVNTRRRLAMSANSFTDYSAFMARISKLEEARKNNYTSCRRRSSSRLRGFKHYLSEHCVSEEGIAALYQHSLLGDYTIEDESKLTSSSPAAAEVGVTLIVDDDGGGEGGRW